MNCAIIGATGYTGIELIKILTRHSFVRLTHLTTRQKRAIPVRELIPTISREVNLEVRRHSFSEVKRKTDVIFVCLPHTEAMLAVKQYREAGKIVIDLSADYRLKNAAQYQKWYKTRHLFPSLLKSAVYGLTEINRSSIRKADLIANPGCYPTGAALGLAPLLERGLVDLKSIVVDAKSGVTGAGKKLSVHTQFSELDENFYAYKVNRHQHMPEIVQTLEKIAGKKVGLTFVPHLLPVQRGILTVIYAKKTNKATPAAIRKAFLERYSGEPFIRLKAEETFPALRDVQNTNYCDIGFTVEPKSGRVIVITAIDNLLKGASGQAVQNMNVRCGFSEEEGIPA